MRFHNWEGSMCVIVALFFVFWVVWFEVVGALRGGEEEYRG